MVDGTGRGRHRRSRGADLDIARALGGHGCTVYVTGRTARADQSPHGGTGIAVVADHSDSDQTKALFDPIARERGRLDILVNNAVFTSPPWSPPPRPRSAACSISPRPIAETPDLTGQSGKMFIGAELAVEYGIKDDGDRQPPSYRDLHGVHPLPQFARILR